MWDVNCYQDYITDIFDVFSVLENEVSSRSGSRFYKIEEATYTSPYKAMGCSACIS